jgi:hypothetical protein
MKNILDSQGNRENALVGKQGILVELFPNPADRPCAKWLDRQMRLRNIPYIRMGKLIWFDPPAVKAAFVRQSIPTRKS